MARNWLTDLTLASFLLLAVASLSVVADTGATIPTECPKSDVGNVTVNLAHENDCSKYYGCSGGQKWLKECPLMDAEGNRLHFNPILQVCDWPVNVNCKLPNGRLAIMRNDIRVECPNVDPINETVHLAHENDCTKFYKCGNGVKYEMECPVYDEEGHKLYFNETLQACDWPWNVKCEETKKINILRKIVTPQKAVEPVAEVSKKCPKDNQLNQTIHLAHETDCTKFYKCSFGVKYEMDCPEYDEEGHKLYFNETLQVCDWPWNVKCEEPKTLNLLRKVVEPVAEVSKKCPKDNQLNQTVHLAHETDCTKFYKCSFGIKYEMDCPEYDEEGHKLYFNETLQVCDWPWNVKCEEPKTLNLLRKVVEPVAEVSKKCPKDNQLNQTVHLAHETDCTKFYKCSFGIKYEMDCPEYDEEGHKLYFNETLQVCDWPWNVKCEEPKKINILRKTLAPQKAVEPIAEVSKKCPKDNQLNQTVHLAHETDCTKFYKCSFGIKYEMDCPEYDEEGHKLYFNETLQVCDWPWNVDCEEPETTTKMDNPKKSLQPMITNRKAIESFAKLPTECPKVDPTDKTLNLAHETDCTKYYACSHGKKWLMDCPFMNANEDKLHFNVETQLCDFPENAKCNL